MVPRKGFSVDLFVDEKRCFATLASYGAKSWQSSSCELAFAFDRAKARRRILFVLDCLCEHPASVSVRFCGLDEMRATNESFRGKPKPTDVLSFPPAAGTIFDENKVYLGDILICLPVAEFQARQHRHSMAAEVERLVVHGLVHLAGFDHERGDGAWRVQEALEKALRRELKEAFGTAAWCGCRARRGAKQ